MQGNCSYSLSSPLFCSSCFENFGFAQNCENNYQPLSYDYKGYGLSEIVLLSKYDRLALDEYLHRIDATLYSYSRCYVRVHNFAEFTEVYSHLEKTALTAVKLFNPLKGDFMHLFRRMMKISLNFISKNNAVSYLREVKYFGLKIRDAEAYKFLCDSQPSGEQVEESIRMKLDLEEYQKYLTSQEKTILELYLKSFSFLEISSYTGVPVSTVSYQIYIILDELKERHNRKMI